MNVKVAVFGREESIIKLSEIANRENTIEIVPFTYRVESETIELIERAFICDVYIFTEALSFLFVKDKIKRKRLPAILVRHDEHMTLTNLFLKRDAGLSLNRFSIDIDNEDVVNEVLHDLKINNDEIYIYDYGLKTEHSIDSIVDHHSKLWLEGKIDYVITSVKSVVDKLRVMDIPVHSMITPEANLRKVVEQAKSIIRFDSNISAQVVSGHIQIKDPDTIPKQKLKELMEKLLGILEKFSKKTDVSIYQGNDYEFILFGTKALIHHLTNHYRDFPLLREIKSELKVPVNIGYGFGLTAKQSSINVGIALETCNEADDTSCYIVNERQEIIGPIGVKKEFDASKLYHALIHKARLNNELSYNFIDFIRNRNNEPFSSNDIANYYKVTKRSAERTVNKLLSGDVIRVSGEERPYQKGRPRKLFTLNQ
ncbi:hypothetical protein [Oceanobacillus sp. Castelsardo]|uniref:hypothetical protein n=1 Tax=Oceanobacillus sp. Castelsardo TaxID=1851204 RepID=UPI0008390585|nr:hypothetical protein [Oceanobacillus sp. Castelsardo]